MTEMGPAGEPASSGNEGRLVGVLARRSLPSAAGRKPPAVRNDLAWNLRAADGGPVRRRAAAGRRRRARQGMVLAAVAALALGGVVLPATAAQAEEGCDVDYQANTWTDGPGTGGFVATVTVTNLGDPIEGWDLTFTLPGGQAFLYGWNADWQPGAGGLLTAGSLSWNASLGTGDSAQIGFGGRWSGVYTDPTAFQLNGVPCVGEPGPGPERVDNPYQDAQVYVDPDWVAQVLTQANATPGELGQQMAQVATHPTAVWLDDIDALTTGLGLAEHLDEALAQQAAAGGDPMVVQLVLYNLPGRDCTGFAAPGELSLTPTGLQRYRTDYIDPIVDILGQPEYADLRIVTVVEPNALSSLLFDSSQGFLDCEVASTTGIFVAAVRYALAQMASVPTVYAYLDFPHSGLGGYPDNFATLVNLYTEVVDGPAGPGFDSVTGLVTNATQYAPLTEPFLPDPDLTVGGIPLWQSEFYDFNRHVQEQPYAQEVRDAFVANGFPDTIGVLVDTGRNGWGGPDRPTEVSTSNDVNTYVDESRIDRRPNRFVWCNQAGAGLGARPAAEPAPGVDAYVWVRPPGESDGVADPAAPADPDRPYLQHRNWCDPLWSPPQGALIPTNALPDAPHFRLWFPELFAQLVTNAHPPVPTS